MTRINRFLQTVCVACMLCVATIDCMASHLWTPLKSEVTGTKTIMKDEEIEIQTLPSVIMLNINQTSKIEIFSILGRLLSSETLPPGSYEYRVESHGIYIVKIGDMTCKVAL